MQVHEIVARFTKVSTSSTPMQAAREELEHRAHLRIEPLRVLHERLGRELDEGGPLLRGLGNDLLARDVEAHVGPELDRAVGVQVVVLVQAREAFLHPDRVALADALELREVHQVHELMLQALPRVARLCSLVLL